MLKSETDEHKKIKEILASKLKNWCGTSMKEYLSSGCRLAAFSRGFKPDKKILFPSVRGYHVACRHHISSTWSCSSNAIYCFLDCVVRLSRPISLRWQGESMK